MSASATDAATDAPRVRRVFRRPRSITGLVVASFGLVALPLIVAIAASVVYVDRLNQQSERLVMQGVAVTRDSKRLDSLLIAMERSARQYRVLHHAELIDRFRKQAREFDNELKALAHLRLDTVPDWNLDALEHASHVLMQRIGTSDSATDAVIRELNDMSDLTAGIADQGSLFVDRELARLQATAADARIFLMLCIFALIPGVIALAVFFTRVLARPLREILEAVTRLGDADFSRRVELFAPAAELDRLGTRLDWMRRRLATLENEKQQFIRHMSHELKTPLASIREGTELLRDGTVGSLSQAQAEVADILQRNSLELASLIENLLDFAAWQQHRAKLEYERFDICALIEAVVKRQKLTIEGQQITVIKPDSTIQITADRDRMHLIIDNLLANAVKFSPHAGRVLIDVTQQAETTELRVTDSGPGVPEDEREHVFDAFFQGRNAPGEATGVQGTGIGLSVVRECAQAHGGIAYVDNAAEGGAVFHVRIPDPHAV